MQVKQLVRTVPAALAFALLLGTSTSSADAFEMAIATKVVDELEASWNAGDGSAYAAQFWPEAELVNIFGAAIEGQSAIEQRLSEILQGAFRGSQMTSEVRKVRRLGERFILVDVDQANTGTVHPDAPEKSRTPMHTRMKHVLEMRGGEWRIIASQNTQVSAPEF